MDIWAITQRGRRRRKWEGGFGSIRVSAWCGTAAQAGCWCVAWHCSCGTVRPRASTAHLHSVHTDICTSPACPSLGTLLLQSICVRAQRLFAESVYLPLNPEVGSYTELGRKTSPDCMPSVLHLRVYARFANAADTPTSMPHWQMHASADRTKALTST